MRTFFHGKPGVIVSALIGLGLGCPDLTGADQTNVFFFSGPEIFPIENLISHLHVADVDGDGKQDLIVVNNARSKISLLFNQTGRPPEASRPKPVKREINELPPDSRFRIESIASEKRVFGLVVADLNSDRKPDIAYFGEPKELVVQYSQGSNVWSTPKRWPADDGVLDMNALASGDLNGDGYTDLLLLGESAVHFWAQKADHSLAEPEKIPYSGAVKAMQVLDINGDGKQDLLLVNWDNPNPFRFRLQHADGHLGPEVHFALSPIRSYCTDDLDGDGKTEVITIAQKSGRARIANFVQKPAESLSGSFLAGEFQITPLSKTAKARRGALWADINGDQLSDLLVAEPDSGQVTVFLQGAEGTMGAPKTFSTLTGVGEICAADWDGDGQTEVFMLSSDERQIGVTKYDRGGRMPFPTVVTVDGRPLTAAAGVLDPKEKPVLAVVTDQDGKRELLIRTADGKTTRQKLSESFKSNPSSMTIQDANQDGLADLVVLIPYEKVKVLLQVRGKPFDELDVAPPGGSTEQPWLSSADVDGDGRTELLLPQKNFLRAVVLQSEPALKGSTNKPGWTFKVKEQVNGAASSSRIAGAAAVRNGTNAVASLFLLDTDRRGLTLCERDTAGVWQVVKTILLPVTEYVALQAISCGATNAFGIGFLGLNSAAWLPLSGRVWELRELDDYETPIKDGYLHDVVAGDLNNDGRKDLVFIETAKNHVDLVRFEPPHKLAPATRWQVFEERTFRSRRSETAEPREAVIGDFNGDGRSDLAVIVHDRVLVYPQE